MFTLAICTILNDYTQVNIKILLMQTYHTSCVSFSCQFILVAKVNIKRLEEWFYGDHYSSVTQN